jgi:hypothetical protein
MFAQCATQYMQRGLTMSDTNNNGSTTATMSPPQEVERATEMPTKTVQGAIPAIQAVEEVVNRYYANLLASVKACLAVICSLAIGRRTKPLSLILEGPSGFGKTATVQMSFPLPKSPAETYIYRSDKFTPKAFVTHAASVSLEELASMDLLPKLKDKVLITKELAPIFRGKVDELQANFSILISVLDGKGFTSDTGMRGQRGYQETILFNWIGATTPLPASTHRIMSQLGTRLLFYEVPATQPTEEQLLLFAETDNSADGEALCQQAVNEFIEQFFSQHPVGGVSPREFAIHKDLLLQLVRWAQLLVQARAEVRFDEMTEMPISAAPPEAPFKVVTYFKDLARGHALVHGRTEVTEADLALVEHVATSSIPGHLRPIVRQLRTHAAVTTKEAEALCEVSNVTARKYLHELALLDVCTLEKGARDVNRPDTVRLAAKYAWLNPDLES